MQQHFREPQVRGRTDRKKLGEAFDNAKDQGQQVIVQSSSEQRYFELKIKDKGTVSQVAA
jgi:hypothetical protein